MVRALPILQFWPQMLSLTLELSQKIQNNYVFEKIFKHSLNFEHIPPLISGLSLVSQNFSIKSYLHRKLSMNIWGLARPPPP